MSKHVIIGTAGHVDHGKTMLIKALSGIDTDRLKEEKKRGITIELGFAHIPLPDGEQAGIVDVPGHEKFIRNMLAGAGGMDLVLLVVAADEGFMPQTREHLGILSLLDIKEGIIVLTKIDMVEPDWVEMVSEEIREEVKGTFLENAPILPVSAMTGEGLDKLKEVIYEKVSQAKEKNVHAPARIPIDRVFSIDGFGTVITGTLLEGEIKEGDELMLYPEQIPVKVRNVQVHSQTVPTAYAGQRTAINLAALKKEDLQKGDTLAKEGSLDVSLMLDVKLSILGDCERLIENGSRLHFYHGTREVLCKLVLLDRDALSAGESGYAQLRFTEPVATKKGDHFVVRFYSPVETVGGGIILDSNPAKHKRNDESVVKGLSVKESGSLTDLVAQKYKEEGAKLSTNEQIAAAMQLSKEQLAEELDRLQQDGTVLPLTEKISMHTDCLSDWGRRLETLLREFHQASPLLIGIKKEDLKGKFPPAKDAALLDTMLKVFTEEDRVRIVNGRVTNFTVEMTGPQKKLFDEIEETYRKAGMNVPGVEEILAAHPKETDLCRQILEALLEQDRLVSIAPQMYFHRESYEASETVMRKLLEEKGSVTLAEFRDACGTSRKYALALLELFDRRGITAMSGEARVKGKNF